jgi:thiamine biosynthesis lipoprotein
VNQTPAYSHVEAVMGTMVSIDIRSVDGRVAVDEAMNAVVDWLHQVDATFSPFRPESDLSRLQRGEVDVDDCRPEMAEVLSLARACEERTGRAYTLYWRADGLIDPTGLVKGWAAEQASDYLTGIGLPDHCINAAGDVRLHGRPAADRAWVTGILHPLFPGRLIAAVEADDAGIATSGPAERGAHIIDPRSGAPATVAASATVIGPDLGRADAYATAAVSLGLDAVDLLESLEQDGWESLFISVEGEVWASRSFPGHFVADGIRPEVVR